MYPVKRLHAYYVNISYKCVLGEPQNCCALFHFLYTSIFNELAVMELEMLILLFFFCK